MLTRARDCLRLLFVYVCISGSRGEHFPFFIHADQVFVKCANGKLESFSGTASAPPVCSQTAPAERVSVLHLFIQCPDGRLHLELNRTFTSSVPTAEYSMTALHPHCFIEQSNEPGNHSHFLPYQTRYTSENGTFAQVISFQCEHNLSVMASERWRWHEQFYLFFKLMNYGLCRYLIQFTYANGKCHRLYQQVYKIHAHIKHSVCYYQLGLQPPDIALGYLDQLLYTNVSAVEPSVPPVNSGHPSVIIMTALIAGLSLCLCAIVFAIMYRLGLFRA